MRKPSPVISISAALGGLGAGLHRTEVLGHIWGQRVSVTGNYWLTGQKVRGQFHVKTRLPPEEQISVIKNLFPSSLGHSSAAFGSISRRHFPLAATGPPRVSTTLNGREVPLSHNSGLGLSPSAGKFSMRGLESSQSTPGSSRQSVQHSLVLCAILACTSSPPHLSTPVDAAGVHCCLRKCDRRDEGLCNTT